MKLEIRIRKSKPNLASYLLHMLLQNMHGHESAER